MPDTESTSRRLLLRDRIVLSRARCPWFTLSPASSTLSWTLWCGNNNNNNTTATAGTATTGLSTGLSTTSERGEIFV